MHGGGAEVHLSIEACYFGIHNFSKDVVPKGDTSNTAWLPYCRVDSMPGA